MIYPFSHTKSRKLLRVVSATAAAFLCATMFTGCFKKDSGPSTDASSGPNLVESASTEPSTETTAAPATEATTEAPKTNVAVVKEKTVALSSPSTTANTLATLNAGDEVEVNRVEYVPTSGLTWAYIPLKGWVQTDYLDMTHYRPRQHHRQQQYLQHRFRPGWHRHRQRAEYPQDPQQDRGFCR